MGPQKRNVEDKQNIFDFSGLWKHAKCGPKQAREFFPANPNLADILREMDFDFENCFGREGLGPQIWPDNFKTLQMPSKARPTARRNVGQRPKAEGPAEGPTHALTKAQPDSGTPKRQNGNSQNYK